VWHARRRVGPLVNRLQFAGEKVMVDPEQKKAVAKVFRRAGFMLQSGAARCVVQAAVRSEGALSSTQLAEQVVVRLRGQSDLRDSLLAEEAIADIVESVLHSHQAVDQREGDLNGDCSGEMSDSSGLDHLTLVDCIDLPEFRFSMHQKMFFKEPCVKKPVVGEASDKIALFKARYHLLNQRLLRNELFCPPVIDLPQLNNSFYKITQIASLSARSHQRDLYCVFGLLRETQDGHFALEDLSGTIEANISRSRCTKGVFSLGTYVLAEGRVREVGDKSVFDVATLGFPPAEPRLNTLSHFPDMTLSMHDSKLNRSITTISKDIVFLSNVFLDKAVTFSNLETLFSFFRDKNQYPAGIFLIGNFTSYGFNSCPSHVEQVQKHFESLGQLFKGYPELISVSLSTMLVDLI